MHRVLIEGSQMDNEAMNQRGVIESLFTGALYDLPDAALPFAAILAESLALHSQKSKDYGTDGDPYANIRACAEFGIEPWLGAVLRANDKMTRLKQFARKGELANESAEDSLLDNCVYFVIALMLYREASQP